MNRTSDAQPAVESSLATTLRAHTPLPAMSAMYPAIAPNARRDGLVYVGDPLRFSLRETTIPTMSAAHIHGSTMNSVSAYCQRSTNGMSHRIP